MKPPQIRELVPAQRLLVLGASRYQLPAIQTAKACGFYVITADNIPSNPGHVVAHQSLDIDTTDQAGILRAARELRVSGVIAPCTDVAVPTATTVAHELNLPGPSALASHILVSKIRFREFQLDKSLPTPRFQVLSEDSDLERLDSFSDGPCVLKPEGSSGSKGVFIVRNQQELSNHLPQTLAFSRTKQAVIEQFIPGLQGTIEGILNDGKLNPTLLTDRLTPAAPYVTTLGHIVPSSLPAYAQERLIADVERVCSLLQQRHGLIDCDFVWTGEKIFLIEMSPRMGGNSLIRLWESARHIDYVRHAIAHACGLPCELPADPPLIPTAILLLGVWKYGKLRYDEAQLQALRIEPWIEDVQIEFPQGSQVFPFINGRHRIGEAVLHARDRAELDRRIVEFHARLRLETA